MEFELQKYGHVWVYNGEINDKKQQTGEGSATLWKDKEWVLKYRGMWLNGAFHGQGKVLW